MRFARRARVRWYPVAALVAFAGCSSAMGGPASPPTFVLAWVAPGGAVRSLESVNTAGWVRSAVDPQATTLTSSLGPALAHDGRFTWMLMWVNGPELQYKVGLGGRTAAAGIEWERSATVGTLVVNTNGSPALAHGNGRWVAVFRRIGGQLYVVRSRPGSATAWDIPSDVVHADVTPRPATSTHSPAMVFGRFGGQDVFVLVYVHPSLGAVAATSPDGLTWSPTVTIGPAEKDPALAARDGRLYALLSRQVSVTGSGSSFHGFVFRSTDASSWSQIATYPAAANNVTGAGMAYGACRLIVTEQIGGALGGSFVGISERGGTPAGPCQDPTGFSIGNDRAISLDLVNNETVGNSGARTAVTFGADPRLLPRRLLITEWYPEVVELHLDEPPGHPLPLSGISLEVRAKPNHQARADLLGTIQGGEFQVVFEEFGYTGPPVIGTFTDPIGGRLVPGIKVRQGFFGWNLGGLSTSLRLSGRSAGGMVDDVLLIADRPRPAIGGTFIEDTPSPVTLPLQSNTLGRKWSPTNPLDNDRESDWRAGPRTFGTPTQ